MMCRTTRTEEDRANEVIEKQIKSERDRVMSEVKLLLLGTGESGKSTVAKQLKIMHLNGFTDEEREAFRHIIHSNIIESTATLVKYAKEFDYTLKPDLQTFAARFNNTNEYEEFLNPETAKKIAELWRDPSIQQTYERRSEYQLPGSVDYLMEHVVRLLDRTSEVTDDDVLRCRMRTMGIVEIEFQVDGMYFKVVDVGGQRGERKKWFHCFASVTAVIFCVALNEYDEKLFEDHRVNRMVEAITLFKDVCNNKFFNDPNNPTSMIIFLNKSDLFDEKIKKVPLTTLFPDYKGGPDPAAGAKYILGQLLAQNKFPQKLIFSHVTCATDTQNVRVVFNAVRTAILKRSLSEANIM